MTLKAYKLTGRAYIFARSILLVIRRSFSRLSITELRTTVHVGPRLKYDSPVVICTSTEMGEIKRIQCYATRLAEGLRGTDCGVLFRVLRLFAVRYRRHRNDLICLCKILRGDMRPEFRAGFSFCRCDRMPGLRLIPLKLNLTGLSLGSRLRERLQFGTHSLLLLWKRTTGMISNALNKP